MIEGFNHLTLTVHDLDLAFEFYRDVLGLKPLAKRRRKSAYFLAGEDWLALVFEPALGTDDPTKANPQRPQYAHLALTVSEANFGEMSSRIKASGAEIWQANSSPGESLYFLDPSGNRLEIHAGNWKARLGWLKRNPDPNVELFHEELQ